MRMFLSFIAPFLLLACEPFGTKTPPASLPTVAEKVGIYKSAAVYAGRTEYEFEIEGKQVLISVDNLDTLNQPVIPSNLTLSTEDGVPDANPLLVGQKFNLTYGPKERLKSIGLVGPHDPSNPEIPALPENYSGLLAVGTDENSRAYLNLFADLTAILLVNYEMDGQPMYKIGRWTRTANGQKVHAQFGAENWDFAIRGKSLILLTKQMGSAGLRLTATNDHTVCNYVHQWLSLLSSIDGEEKVLAENMTNDMPLANILRTEHAYMSLYGGLETVFQVGETTTSESLRANPTVGGVCELVLHSSEGGH